ETLERCLAWEADRSETMGHKRIAQSSGESIEDDLRFTVARHALLESGTPWAPTESASQARQRSTGGHSFLPLPADAGRRAPRLRLLQQLGRAGLIYDQFVHEP